ncbi:MAG TPA: hypothetical protein PLI09_27715 [Candidatus Hydrogenedentes bacterium]|nr:hypothetical protein [Candidatus Hydrogenedentota bacterium]
MKVIWGSVLSSKFRAAFLMSLFIVSSVGILLFPDTALAIGRGGSHYCMSIDVIASGGGQDASPSYREMDSVVGGGLLCAFSSSSSFGETNATVPAFASGEGDIIPPTVVKIEALSASKIDITFSEPMGEGVTNPENYSLTSGEEAKGSGIMPQTVSSTGNPVVYSLTWGDGVLEMGEIVTVTVEIVVEDVAGNQLGMPNFATTQVPGLTPSFQIPLFR